MSDVKELLEKLFSEKEERKTEIILTNNQKLEINGNNLILESDYLIKKVGNNEECYPYTSIFVIKTIKYSDMRNIEDASNYIVGA